MTDPAPYQQIANYLRDQILGGHLRPGQPIPSENALAKQFGYVRSTATRAIETLRSEGLISTTQGARSTVRERPGLLYLATGENFRRRRASGKANDIAEAEAQGFRARNKLLSVGEVPAPADIAERLAVAAGAPVLAREQLNVVVREEGGAPIENPMKRVRVYYRPEFAAGTALTEPRLIKGGTTGLIEDPDGPFRRIIKRSVEDLELRMPTPDETQLLAIERGAPVAVILRTTYDMEENVIEVAETLLPGDRYKLRYEIDLSPR